MRWARSRKYGASIGDAFAADFSGLVVEFPPANVAWFVRDQEQFRLVGVSGRSCHVISINAGYDSEIPAI